MMTNSLSPADFLKLPGVIFDVRSPGEYAHACIPGAINLALFANEERAAVGIEYKQKGQAPAISLGLKLIGPKLAELAAKAQVDANGKLAKIHCWRGGMRSQAMAWLLSFSGLSTVTLHGGYKAFRHFCLKCFEHPYRLIVLGGMTGCGKTAILQTLTAMGEQVLDLEAIACHKGSSFGMIAQSLAPSNEQFENEIAHHLSSFDGHRIIWIEDESRLIGTCHLPGKLFSQMRAAPLIVIQTSYEERLSRLLEEYGLAPINHLREGIKRIAKQLGGQRVKWAFEALENGKVAEAITLVLEYYDKAYAYSLSKRTQPSVTIARDHHSVSEWAEILLNQTFKVAS
jgi:tRNA 2-selenouridine synthase